MPTQVEMSVLEFSTKHQPICSTESNRCVPSLTALVFLDEPTSGLDAAAAFQVMTFVRELAANTDSTVLVTIHQPSSTMFNSFHGTLLLSDGRVVFQVGGRCTSFGKYSACILWGVLYTSQPD